MSLLVIGGLLSLSAGVKERKDDRTCSLATLRRLGLNCVIDYSDDQSAGGEVEGAVVPWQMLNSRC